MDDIFSMRDRKGHFIWDSEKERLNIIKHGVDFTTAAMAFNDPTGEIYVDKTHSVSEARFFCLGKVRGEILTVRFTYRKGMIRIFGAGFWRSGRKRYEGKKE